MTREDLAGRGDPRAEREIREGGGGGEWRGEKGKKAPGVGWVADKLCDGGAGNGLGKFPSARAETSMRTRRAAGESGAVEEAEGGEETG